jgi:hypothetical protein
MSVTAPGRLQRGLDPAPFTGRDVQVRVPGPRPCARRPRVTQPTVHGTASRVADEQAYDDRFTLTYGRGTGPLHLQSSHATGEGEVNGDTGDQHAFHYDEADRSEDTHDDDAGEGDQDGASGDRH